MSDEDQEAQVVAEAPEAPLESPAAPAAAAPAAEVQLTAEQVLAQYQNLASQARAAGQSLFLMTAQHYMTKVLTAVDSAFAGFEGWVAPGSKEEKEKTEPEQRV